MAELVEYCLVFLVSSLFVAGSVATYDSFSGFTSGLEFRTASASISRLASDALASGSASGAFAVPSSTVSCEGGVLTFVSEGMALRQAVGATCDFSASLQGGVHAFGFSYDDSRLTMTVS